MICNICEKESVCKLIDGSDVVKCAEFLSINPNDYIKDAGMTNEEAKDYIREWCPYDKQDEIIKALSNSDEDCISRQGAIDALGYNIRITSDGGLDEYRTVIKEILWKIYDTQKAQIEALPSIQPKSKTDALDKIKAEIKEWYWQADKQALAKDPCVVDAMIDLFIRTINKYKVESEDKE